METDFQPFELERLLLGLPPPLYYLEIALKAVIVFALLLLVMRIMGKRGQKNLSPMQQMLLIALGSSAGDAMLYPTVPLAYAALILIGVTLLTAGFEELADHFRPAREVLESKPRLLVRDGVIDRDALDKERTTERELFSELRIKGARSLTQVECAILEPTGDISVFLNQSTPGSDDLLEYIREPASGTAQQDGNTRAKRNPNS